MVSLFIASCPYIPLTESMIGEPRTNPLEWSKWKLGEIAGGLHPKKIVGVVIKEEWVV
jgi:hypothetical protein